MLFASIYDPWRVLRHDSERRVSQGSFQGTSVPAAKLWWEGVSPGRAPLAPVSPALCCRFCSCAVEQNKPKLVCLLGLRGAVLQPWKLVSCVSLASAVRVSQGSPLKCFQLLAAPRASCGEPAAHPRAARQAAAAVPPGAQVIVLPWHSPSGSAVPRRLCPEAGLAPEVQAGSGCPQRAGISALPRGWRAALGGAERCSEGGGALPQGRAIQGTFALAAIPAPGRAELTGPGWELLPGLSAPGAPLGTALRLAPAQVCWGGEEAPSGLFFVLCTLGKGKHDLAPKH